MTTPDPPWPLADPRSAEQIARDQAAVLDQVGKLNPPPDDDSQNALFTRLGERQLVSRNGTGIRCTVLPQPSGPVLVADSELVVESDEPRVQGYEPADGPGGSIRVLRSVSPKDAEALRADAAGLRSRNVTANVNPIMPLGYVVKSDVFPGKTQVLEQYRLPANNTTDPTVRVAIIDTGRTAESRNDGWFAGVTPVGTDKLDEVDPEGRNDYFAGHGSFTAGIVRQLSHRCEIYVYRFTGCDGVGTDAAAAAAMLRAVQDAGPATERRLIINASFGAPAIDDVPPLALRAAVKRIFTQRPDVLIVASAGNDGLGEKNYPGAFDEYDVKAVGALKADLSKADFSNYGDWVDCSAVGVGVVSTFVEGTVPPEPTSGFDDIDFPADAWAVWSGTSFSAPQISGAVARLCTQSRHKKPKAAFDELIAGQSHLDGYGARLHLLPGTPL